MAMKETASFFAKGVDTHEGRWYSIGMTTIPFQRKSINSNQDVNPFSPALIKQQSTKCADKNDINKLHPTCQEHRVEFWR
jgi:hypothetical protein